MPEIHVFSGSFGSEVAARRYTERQWVEDSEDPAWALRDDLSVGYLDSDFVETIFGEGKLDYLVTQVARESDAANLVEAIPESADTLVLIMSSALDVKRVRLQSTPELRYHGEYQWRL